MIKSGMRWPAIAIVCIACGGGGQRHGVTTTALAPSAQASSERAIVGPQSQTEVTCPGAVMRVEAGVDRGLMCPNEVKSPLVVVDLRDAWTPSLFAPGEDGHVAPDYRDTYLKIASEHDDRGHPIDDIDALGELYGVVPSLAIVRERLSDAQRYDCHAAIDSTPIKNITLPIGQDHGPQMRAWDWTREGLYKQLEFERVRRKLPDLAALADIPGLKASYDKWKWFDDYHQGIIAAQKHLVCEGYMRDQDANGVVTWRTGNGAEQFQRRNFLMPNERLDPETREALATDPKELDYRFALRILRERVVDAMGLLEDGTAADGPQPIMDRYVDPIAMRMARGHQTPLPNAAPDLVSAATETAARALGWTGPDETLAWLEAHRGGLKVALALPPVPAYHAAHMDISVEIDRGDVYYDERPVDRVVARRPTLVLYVNDNGTKRPLVRWPTTIGGWADQVLADGSLVQRWKESDVGPRVWRDIYAAPTWLPPKSTPDRDLVKNLYTGKWGLKESTLGPSPHAAYGLVLLEHYQVVKLKDGTERFDDNGIGTHGSSTVTSIVHGTSHGCHRLYNQLAVRLADFLLKHRDHVAKGQTEEWYRRRINYKGTFMAKIDTRGYLYELTPPVQVNVLKGTIRSTRKIPPTNSAPARP
jgi:L,D-transpeptidase-like protein